MTLQQTIRSLAVPAAFARLDASPDLLAWKSNTVPLLNQLDPLHVDAFSISELADLIHALAPLTAVAPWSSPEIRSLASARLAQIPASEQLITHILTLVIKPLFAPTPHPRLHTSTARVLSRPADVQDTYVEQTWKDHPGLDEVIRWSIVNTESPVYETSWPLFLPPVMSFLDDYQVPYKLLGVRLVSDMLTRVPSSLLVRTGVDTLMFNSFVHSLSHLGDQSTPDFIRLAVTTTIQLIDLTTPSTSSSHDNNDGPLTLSYAPPAMQLKSLSTRFSRLSSLLSSSLLGTIIMYTPTFLHPVQSSTSDSDSFADPEHVQIDPVRLPLKVEKQSFNPTLVAAAQSLPPLLSALGIAAVRFLKGVIPVLAEWLALPLPVITPEAGVCEDSESFATDVGLHLASLSSLSVLFCTCTPRIGGWSTTIIDAIGRCWVGCLDMESQRRDGIDSMDSLGILKKQLKRTVAQLAEVYPAVIKNEYAVLLAFDKDLFEDLVEGV